MYVHCGYFSYGNAEYKGANELITPTCPIHGDFEVKANNHLNGANCKKCQIEGITHEIRKLPKINASTKKLDTETFKKKYHEKFGSKLDLSKIKYVNAKTKVIATCPIHGDFLISPMKLMCRKRMQQMCKEL